MKYLFFASLLLALSHLGGCTIKQIQFDQDCEGYLKRAADANSVELAREQLKVALDYLKSENLTSGYTNVLWKLPENDLSFWYGNIKTAYEDLCSVSPDATGLEKSNVLIKLRETLLDHRGDSGDVVTIPPNITRYPNQILWLLWAILSWTGVTVFGVWWLIRANAY